MPTPSNPARPPTHLPLIAAVALLGWFALLLQLVLAIRLSAADGRGTLAGIWTYLGYFTILTNLLVALALNAQALDLDDRLGRFFRHPGVATAIAANIAVVSIAYNLLLRQLWQPQGWQWLADVLLHDVMPALFLLFWWFVVDKAALRVRQIVSWLWYPLGYLVYVLARGAIDRWYPYPFLDVNAIGYGRVLINACGVGLAFIVIALLLLALARLQLRRSNRNPSQA
jgi:hypothetical protein